MRLAVGGEEAVAEDEHHEQRGVVEEDPHADHIPGRGVHAPARASGEGEGKGKGKIGTRGILAEKLNAPTRRETHLGEDPGETVVAAHPDVEWWVFLRKRHTLNTRITIIWLRMN